MGTNAYIQREDLGLTVLGTPQYAYTVDGLHAQNYLDAVFKVTLCRVDALEHTLSAYNELIKGRQTKIDDLGTALASIASALGTKTKEKETEDTASIGDEAATILKNYGFSAKATMTYGDLMTLQQDVQYAIDETDNDLQQDMSALQNYVTKRDDALQTVSDQVSKVGDTLSKGIQKIGS